MEPQKHNIFVFEDDSVGNTINLCRRKRIMKRQKLNFSVVNCVGLLTLKIISHDYYPKSEVVGISDKFSVYKRMLKDSIGSDMVIKAQNGAYVKCHKSILEAHSPVFSAMFSNDMLEMDDMSKEGVDAFLAFLYHWEMTAAQESCSVAFELLCAGEKFFIPALKDTMTAILTAKGAEWFNAEVSIKLFLFARAQGGNGKALQVAAIAAMKL